MQFQADVIMALAGSNGGSWSTTYSAKSIMKPVNESNIPSGESEGGGNVNRAFPQEFHGILAAIGNTSQGIGSADRISTPGGNPFKLIHFQHEAFYFWLHLYGLLLDEEYMKIYC